MSPADSKNIPVLQRDVVNSLDLLHRAIAEVMAERGEVVIVDAQPAQGVQG